MTRETASRQTTTYFLSRPLMKALALLLAALGLALPAQAQTPVVEAKNADEEAVMQVNDDGGLLGLGVFDEGVIPAEGPGTRLMWHPAKAAFRAGRLGVSSLSDGSGWDEANVGVYSVAFGRDTEASGDASTAMGEETTASGSYATAMGISTTASGNGSTAMGSAATASGGEATAMGSGTEASGNSSTAFGDDTEASGFASTAMGRGTTASGGQSTAMGRGTTAGGDFSLAAGRQAVVRDGDHGTFAWADNEFADFTSTGENQFLVRAAGGVGLGTNAPLAQLHVAKAINAAASLTTHVALIENTSTGTNGDVLVLKSGASTPTTSNNFISFLNGADDFVGAIDGNGSGGVVYRTSGGDFAEMLPRINPEESIAPGDVVGVIGGRITKATEGAEQVLVVTGRPAVLGNAHLDEAASHPVAFVGQVPVRVRGSVDIGDWIVPSGRNDGTAVAVGPEAMRLADHAQVIGRAWEAASGESIDKVTVAVGLDRAGALVGQLQRQEAQIKALRAENASTQERLAALEAQVQDDASVIAGWSGWGAAGLLALLVLGGLALSRRRTSSALPVALLAVAIGAVTALNATPVQAQTVSVQNGATLHIANGGILDLNGSTLDLGDFGETARLVETAGGRVTGGLLTATRPLSAGSGAASSVDVAGLGLLFTADQALDAVTVTRGHVVQQGGPNLSIQRYYDLAPVPNGTQPEPFDLTLRYADAELGPLPEPELELFYSADEGATWQRRGVDTRDTDANTVTLEGLASLGEAEGRWTLGASSQPLPVELTAFEAALDGEEAVRLSWTTASETNNAGFHVERARLERARLDRAGDSHAEDKEDAAASDDADAVVWQAVGFVEGAGTTSEARSYRFRDAALPFGAEGLRYRLRQVDLDGTTSYGPEVELTLDAPERVALHAPYPNPLIGRATLRYELPQAGHIRLAVYNALGQRMAVLAEGEQAAGRKEIGLEARRWPSGMYFVRLEVGGAAYTRKLTVVR